MSDSPNTPIRILAAVVIACAVPAFSALPAAAQTARNLVCSGCVDTKDMKKRSVKANRIRNGAVGARAVASNSIPARDLSNEAGAAFVGPVPGGFVDFVDLETDDTAIVRSVTITAPSGGIVIVNASGIFQFAGLSLNSSVTCSITTGTSTIDNIAIALGQQGNSVTTAPFAGTRGFTVESGSTTFRLVCRRTAGIIRIRDTLMTAMFLPTAY